jgi:hypothetical protein
MMRHMATTNALASPVDHPALPRLQALLQQLSDGQLLSIDVLSQPLVRAHSPRLLDSVVVLKRQDFVLLRHLGGQGRLFAREGIGAPLILTPEFIASSQDSFPLELLDIQQRRYGVYGSDHFSTLSFRDEHLRLQCERELKVAGLAMRQRVLQAAHHGNWHTHDIAENMLRVLRGLRQLKRRPALRESPAVLADFATLTSKGLPALQEVISGAHDWEVFQRLAGEIEVLGVLANGW